MTLEEIAERLPNGFHDALLHHISLDYLEMTAILSLSVWMGNLDDECEAEREQYSEAILILKSIQFFSIESPKESGGQRFRGPLSIDLCSRERAPESKQTICIGNFYSALFVSDWNSFIQFAAREAILDLIRPS